MNTGMPTITEENRNFLLPPQTIPAAPLRIKVPSESHQFDHPVPPSTNAIKVRAIIFVCYLFDPNVKIAKLDVQPTFLNSNIELVYSAIIGFFHFFKLLSTFLETQ